MTHLYRINAHSHVLPYPEDIPSFMKEDKIFWLDNERKYMYQDDWKRPITDNSFFPEEKIQWMKENKIDHAFVLTLSQLYGNTLSEENRIKVLQFQNNFNAQLQQKYPEYFTCGFVVNPKNTQEAIVEIRRAVEELQLSFVCLPTHFFNTEGKWKVIFSDETKEVWQEIDKHQLAVEIHPYDGEKIIDLDNESWRFHLVWMLAQCADAYHFMTLKDFPNTYPNTRFCFAHGGMLAQANIGRRITGFEGRPDLFPNQTNPKENIKHCNIFFDSLLHDLLSLELTLKRQGPSQILAGLDDPYPLGEMNNEKMGTYPGKLLDEALKNGIITERDFTNIWCNNSIRWLFGDNSKAIEDFRIRTKMV